VSVFAYAGQAFLQYSGISVLNRNLRGWLPLLLSLLAPSLASAASLTVSIVDQNGQPVADAVVESPLAPVLQAPAEVAVIDQVNKRFVPMVIAIQQGQSVDFPNNDNIRHHVYSFSPIKQFSTELYADVQGDPVLFDKAGVAVLGCNIHDSMVGYIYVSAFQHVAVTDASGTVSFSLEQLPDTISVWHPWSTDPDYRRELSTAAVVDGGTLQVQLTIRQPEQVFGFRAIGTP
jgi:plastocyanin